MAALRSTGAPNFSLYWLALRWLDVPDAAVTTVKSAHSSLRRRRKIGGAARAVTESGNRRGSGAPRVAENRDTALHNQVPHCPPHMETHTVGRFLETVEYEQAEQIAYVYKLDGRSKPANPSGSRRSQIPCSRGPLRVREGTFW